MRLQRRCRGREGRRGRGGEEGEEGSVQLVGKQLVRVVVCGGSVSVEECVGVVVVVVEEGVRW